MPVINAEVRITGVNPDPTVTTTFEWMVQMRFDATDCPFGRNVRNNPIKVDIKQQVQGGNFGPVFNVIRGGTLALVVRARTLTGIRSRPVSRG
jgi:hypothetical protein